MKKEAIIVFLSIAALLIFILAWFGLLHVIAISACKNEIVKSVNSPDNSKKVVVFTVDCGATTGWSTQASILDAHAELLPNATGNAIRLDSNHSQARPLSPQGAPVIDPSWSGSTTVLLQYSKNANASITAHQIDGVKINYSEFP